MELSDLSMEELILLLVHRVGAEEAKSMVLKMIERKNRIPLGNSEQDFVAEDRFIYEYLPSKVSAEEAQEEAVPTQLNNSYDKPRVYTIESPNRALRDIHTGKSDVRAEDH